MLPFWLVLFLLSFLCPHFCFYFALFLLLLFSTVVFKVFCLVIQAQGFGAAAGAGGTTASGDFAFTVTVVDIETGRAWERSQHLNVLEKKIMTANSVTGSLLRPGKHSTTIIVTQPTNLLSCKRSFTKNQHDTDRWTGTLKYENTSGKQNAHFQKRGANAQMHRAWLTTSQGCHEAVHLPQLWKWIPLAKQARMYLNYSCQSSIPNLLLEVSAQPQRRNQWLIPSRKD